VHDEDADAGELATCQLRQAESRVDVPANRGHRRDCPEAVEDADRADVSCVEDVVDARERVDHLGSQKTVRVGDHADLQLPIALVVIVVIRWS
jgi:hypothetical protein